MKDNELRRIVLQKYYDRREENGLIPVNETEFGNEIPVDTALRISEYLQQLELIEFKSYYEKGKLYKGFGRITAKGVDVIENEVEEDDDKEQNGPPYVFVSYQTAQKKVAGQVKNILDRFGFLSFLAHEDIEVSQDWRNRILEELEKADVFLCLLSKEYYESSWCVQESGIAAYRNITIIPLSLDGKVSQGFISIYQAKRLTEDAVSAKEILPGLVTYNFGFGISKIIETIGASRSFREAESNFEVIVPYQDELDEKQARSLMEAIRKNGQVYEAYLCKKKYLPPLLARYGHLLAEDDLNFLQNICSG